MRQPNRRSAATDFPVHSLGQHMEGRVNGCYSTKVGRFMVYSNPQQCWEVRLAFVVVSLVR